MRIVYLGTPDFAVLPLEKLVAEKKYDIVAVVTNPDKPVGRKGIITPPPVKVLAEKYNIPVFQYDKIKNQGVEDLKRLQPDIMITCAFGQILSQEILDIPKLGVINIHASLLPKYRGASPIHFAILNGETKTGVTIMKTDIGVDTGDIICSREVDIGKDETCGELFEKLSDLGANLIVEALPKIIDNQVEFKKQNDREATYTKIFTKQDALIDWKESATSINNKIRAFNPAPVAFCYYKGEPFKIFSASVVNGVGECGKILSIDKELIIACGSGALSLKKVQKAGGKAMSVEDFLRGNKLVKGEFFN